MRKITLCLVSILFLTLCQNATSQKRQNGMIKMKIGDKTQYLLATNSKDSILMAELDSLNHKLDNVHSKFKNGEISRNQLRRARKTLVTQYSEKFNRLWSKINQKEERERMVEFWKSKRESEVSYEKFLLKQDLKSVLEEAKTKNLSDSEITKMKEDAAKKRALNIENRLAIVDNQISLLERNEGNTLTEIKIDSVDRNQIALTIDVNGEPWVISKSRKWRKKIKYDRRTYSDFVFAVGFNNALIEGQSLNDSPYKIAGSRFFEMGWQWRTRVFQNSNWLRFHYGFSFQFNGLKPTGNRIFVQNGDQTTLEEFEYKLDKSKLRMDNLVFPVHFEFGPSKLKETEKNFRYSLRNQFRLGLGAYGGFNLGNPSKIKI